MVPSCQLRQLPSVRMLCLPYDALSLPFAFIAQGLDDHTHRPTLEKLSRDIPVVAAPSAAKIATALGFRLVFSLAHNEAVTLDNVRFRATAGGLVGPPWSTRENGFVVEDMVSGLSIYYEPHVDFVESSVKSAAPEVDVVISPCTNVTFGGVAASLLCTGQAQIHSLSESPRGVSSQPAFIVH